METTMAIEPPVLIEILAQALARHFPAARGVDQRRRTAEGLAAELAAADLTVVDCPRRRRLAPPAPRQPRSRAELAALMAQAIDASIDPWSPDRAAEAVLAALKAAGLAIRRTAPAGRPGPQLVVDRTLAVRPTPEPPPIRKPRDERR